MDYEYDDEEALAEYEAPEARVDYEARITAITSQVTKRRTDAIQGRRNSGIEEEWNEDEDFYRGVDDANRDQLSKPISHTGGAIGVRKVSTTRSTVFINITRPYVDSAAARLSDLLLPTDDKNWSIKPSPIPELMDALNDVTPLEDAETGEALVQEPRLDTMPAAAMGGMPTNLPGVGDRAAEQMGVPQGIAGMQPRQKTVSDVAAEELAQANQKAEAATKQIDDWQIQTHYAGEVRKVIEDCARIGTGVLKGPFPKKYKYRKAEMIDGEGMLLAMVEEIAPASKRISPWDLYPDPDCGDDIHDGAYLFEKDYMTAKQIKDLAGLPGYKDERLAKVLEEGPKRKSEVTRADPYTRDDERFEVWYYYGFLDKDDYKAMGEECEDPLAQVPVILTLINDCIVKCTLSPIESGEFPFDIMPWQRRRMQPWGIGVARQINTAQRMLNAATRNMMDNAGLSAGPQIVLRKGVVTPADGKWEISPRKYWFINEDADATQVQHAFMAVQIPSAQAELSQIIQFALQMAEQTTGMPMLLQGQSGQIGPAAETVGGMTLLANNASTVLRRMARTFDDCITEPHIRRYYEWLMTYGEDDEAKGDFVIDARGSSALVERDLQNQAVMQMAQLVMNPAFGINPQKWFEEACKVQRLDPKRFTFSEEEKAQQQQAAQQQTPPPMPQVEAAKIKAEADLQKAQINAQTQQMRIQKDTDRDVAYVQAQGNRDNIQAQARMQELQLKRELAMLDYANKNEIQLTEVKARLAETSMKLRLQRELSAMGNAAKQVIKPAAEPAGRAPRGQAFQR